MSHDASVWLSVDYSSDESSLSLHESTGKGPLFLAESMIANKGRHCESFIPTLENLLRTVGISLHRISRFITSPGPGSFTGLRVGLASLKGLAFNLSCPIDTIDPSEARAIAFHLREGITGVTAVVSHCRTSLFLLRQFSFSSNEIQARGVLEIHSSLDSVLSRIHPKALVLFDSPNLLNQELSNRGVHYPLRARYLAESLLHSKTRTTYQDRENWMTLNPVYVAPSGAKQDRWKGAPTSFCVEPKS